MPGAQRLRDEAAAPDAPQRWRIRAQDLLLVRRLDMETLQELAQDHACRLHLRVRPGDRVSPRCVLVEVEPDAGAKALDAEQRTALETAIRQAIVLSPGRTFDQDPRFGLIVLCEAGQRALSAAINDPGTAISCLDALARVLLKSQHNAQEPTPQDEDEAPHYDRLTVVPINERDFLQDAFGPLLRDAAGFYEIGVRLQKLLAHVAEHSVNPSLAQEARAYAEQALAYAQERLPHQADQQALGELHAALFAPR